MLLFENGPIKHPRHLVIFHFLPFCFVLFFCVLLFSTYLENTALYTDSHDNRAMCNNHRRWLCEWSFYFCWFWLHCVSSLYTGVVLFFFSFFYKTSASTWAKRARSTRKKNNPTATPLRWRSINSLACVQTSPISFVARGNRRRLRAGNKFPLVYLRPWTGYSIFVSFGVVLMSCKFFT